MALLSDFEGFFGLDSAFADASIWGLHPSKEFDDKWMVLDDGQELPNGEELDLLSAVQPDSAPGTVAFNSLSLFLDTSHEGVGSSKSLLADVPNVLDDRDGGEKEHSGDSASSASADSIASASSKSLMDEFLRLKLADRRRRNRESSSRCYYKRKRRVAAVKENLKEARHRAFLLSSRRQQLIDENAWLRKRIASQGPRVSYARRLMC